MVGAGFGAGAEPLSPSWQNGITLACVAGAAVPLWRWLRDRVHDLAHQLALRVAAERAVRRIAESRAEIVVAREEERLRIRRDLHDGLAPSLASVQLQLKALQRGLREDDPQRGTMAGLIDDLRQTSGDLRRLVYDLRPRCSTKSASKLLCPSSTPRSRPEGAALRRRR